MNTSRLYLYMLIIGKLWTTKKRWQEEKENDVTNEKKMRIENVGLIKKRKEEYKHMTNNIVDDYYYHKKGIVHIF